MGKEHPGGGNCECKGPEAGILCNTANSGSGAPLPLAAFLGAQRGPFGVLGFP